jgi:hypothetical protein
MNQFHIENGSLPAYSSTVLRFLRFEPEIHRIEKIPLGRATDQSATIPD